MESLQAQWERKTFNDWDRRCCVEIAYDEAVWNLVDEIEDEIHSGDEDTKFDLIEILSEDEGLLDAIALDDRDVIENLRNKALRILAENRLEQRRKDYEHGFIQDD